MEQTCMVKVATIHDSWTNNYVFALNDKYTIEWCGKVANYSVNTPNISIYTELVHVRCCCFGGGAMGGEQPKILDTN